MDCSVNLEGKQASAQVAREVGERLEGFVRPLLVELDRHLDKRLVRTFLTVLQVVAGVRNRSQGLLLSELGAYILSGDRAPAGTKRLSNLLHSKKWASELIARFLWQAADTKLDALVHAGEEALVVWDESVLEKAESIGIEG